MRARRDDVGLENTSRIDWVLEWLSSLAGHVPHTPAANENDDSNTQPIVIDASSQPSEESLSTALSLIPCLILLIAPVFRTDLITPAHGSYTRFRHKTSYRSE